jgi:hypothetical protein
MEDLTGNNYDSSINLMFSRLKTKYSSLNDYELETYYQSFKKLPLDEKKKIQSKSICLFLNELNPDVYRDINIDNIETKLMTFLGKSGKKKSVDFEEFVDSMMFINSNPNIKSEILISALTYFPIANIGSIETNSSIDKLVSYCLDTSYGIKEIDSDDMKETIEIIKKNGK